MSVVPLITDLAAEIEQLWRSPKPSFVGIRRVARQLLVEANDASAITDIPFELAQPQWDERSRILASTLNAARLAAWNCGHYLPLAFEAEVTVCGALLADAGLLGTLRKGTQAKDRDERHPLLSAAFAARMSDAPSALPQLIARHHERSDGSGVPMQLTRDRLTRADRHVALAVRFSELSGRDLDLQETLLKLHNEARRGLFDAELSGNLVRSVSGELPAGPSFDQQTVKNWGMTDLGRKRFRVHSSHSSPNAPHFDTSRRVKTVTQDLSGRT